MNILKFTDWLPYARTLTPTRYNIMRIKISQLAPEHQNRYEYLKLLFAGNAYQREAFVTAWAEYCDYLSRIDAEIETTVEYNFPTKYKGVVQRSKGEGCMVNAAWLYWQTGGYDPLGLFSEEDLPAIKATFTPDHQAATREEVIEWLEEQIQETLREERVEQLRALQEVIADQIDQRPGARDLASLAKQFREIGKEIEELEALTDSSDDIDRILKWRASQDR